MKKIFLLSVLLAFYQLARACEICGCGNNNFQIGILPSFSKGFIGLRYTYSQYHSEMKNNPTQFSRDYYHITELWGGAQFGKWQVMVFVQYIQSAKVSDDGTMTASGLGDVSILANHLFLRSSRLSKNEKSTLSHELWGGGGIKLPTGNSSVDQSNPDFNIGDFNSQAGTGSLDYLMNITYNLSYNNSGVVTNVTYRINTANDQNFKFGNRLYASALYFHTITKNEIKIRPNIGLTFQSNPVNLLSDQEIDGSGGYILNTAAGFNFVKGKWGLMLQGFLPIAQDFYHGQTNLQGKAVTGLSYSF